MRWLNFNRVCLILAILLVATAYSHNCNAKEKKGNLSGVLLPYVPPQGQIVPNQNKEEPPVQKPSSDQKKTTKPEKTSKVKEKASPISITALRMEADNKEGWVLFIGKVKAIQKDMVLTSERLKVYLDSKGKVKRVIASGGVRVEQSGRVITSKEAEYNPTKEVVIFTGNPKAWQGKNVVMGKRIIYFVKDKRSMVEGGNGKVSAVLFPKEKKGGK